MLHIAPLVVIAAAKDQLQNRFAPYLKAQRSSPTTIDALEDSYYLIHGDDNPRLCKHAKVSA